MEDEERLHHERLLAICRDYLRILEEQKAHFGIYAPPYLLLEIERYQRDISQIRAKLGTLPIESESSSEQVAHYSAPSSPRPTLDIDAVERKSLTHPSTPLQETASSSHSQGHFSIRRRSLFITTRRWSGKKRYQHSTSKPYVQIRNADSSDPGAPVDTSPEDRMQKDQDAEYLMDIGLLRLFFLRKSKVDKADHAGKSSARKQELLQVERIEVNRTLTRDIHRRTVDAITFALFEASLKQIWLYEQPYLGDEGFIGFTEALRSYITQDFPLSLSVDTVELTLLRRVYAGLFKSLQYTIPPPFEPASDLYSDSYEDLLTSLTEAWILLPVDEGIFKCIDIIQIMPIKSRVRLLRALTIMAPAICRFHAEIVDEIKEAAQRIVDLFP